MSIAVGTVVSVPNSLGPVELLLAYGAEKQKKLLFAPFSKG